MNKMSSEQMQRWLAIGLLLAALLIIGLVVIVPLVGKSMELHEAEDNLVF